MDDPKQTPADVVLARNQNEAVLVLATRVSSYLESARARNTIRGYRSSFQQFQLWCEAASLQAMPATEETVALYLSAQAGRLRAATLEHHLAAIGKAHKAAGFSSPIQDSMLLAETLKGIKRTYGTAAKQKAPVLTEDLRVMLRLLRDNLQGKRDRAILLVGFAGAFRRSELVSLDVTDLKFQSEGLLITLHRSKTDQEGKGRYVAIPHGLHADTCSVRALENWLQTATITEGPVFRPVRKGGTLGGTRLTGHAIASVVKRYAKGAGLPVDLFSGHSLRAGFVTSAARAGEPERRIIGRPGTSRSKWFSATCAMRTRSLTMPPPHSASEGHKKWEIRSTPMNRTLSGYHLKRQMQESARSERTLQRWAKLGLVKTQGVAIAGRKAAVVYRRADLEELKSRPVRLSGERTMQTTERHFVFQLREGAVKISLPIELTEDSSENAREFLELVIRQTRTAAKQADVAEQS